MIQNAAFFQPIAPATVPSGKGAASAQPASDGSGFAGVLKDSQASRDSHAEAKPAGGNEKKGKGALSLVTSKSSQGENRKADDATAGSQRAAGKEQAGQNDTDGAVSRKDQDGSLPQSRETKRGTTPEGDVATKTAAGKQAAGGVGTDGWGAPGEVAAAVTAAIQQAKAEATTTKAQGSSSAAGVGEGSEATREGEGDDAEAFGAQSELAASSADAARLALAAVTVLTAGAVQPTASTTADDGGAASVAVAEGIPADSTLPASAAKAEQPAAPAASEAGLPAAGSGRSQVADAVGTALDSVLPKAQGQFTAAKAASHPDDLQTMQASAKAAYGPRFMARVTREVSLETGNAAGITAETDQAESAAGAATAAGEEPAQAVTATPVTGSQPAQAAKVQQSGNGFISSATEGVQNESASGKDKIPTLNEQERAASPDTGDASGAAALTAAETAADASKATGAQAAAAADNVAKPAESKDSRNIDGAQKGHGQKHQVEQQENATDQASQEVSGTKSASAGHTAKLASVEGGAGQKASADAGKDGASQQGAQGRDAAQALNPAMGLQSQAAPEITQSEAPATQVRNPLHQSLLAQVKDGVVTHDAKGNSQLTIRLNPGELGELKIQVRMQDNRVAVEVQADNKMVKDLLMSNLDSLKEALNGKNFSMDGFDVSTGGGGFQQSLSEQRANPQQQPARRFARTAGYDGPVVEAKVNYVTEKANSLLDVRF